MKSPRIYDTITSIILETIPQVIGIYLFGSRADGTFHSKSDFDVAVLLPRDKPIDHRSLFDLQQDISVSINQDVDLICLNSTTLVMQFLITSNGVLLFARDKTEILKFETLILSMYQRFNEERRGILEEIESSGKIHSV